MPTSTQTRPRATSEVTNAESVTVVEEPQTSHSTATNLEDSSTTPTSSPSKKRKTESGDPQEASNGVAEDSKNTPKNSANEVINGINGHTDGTEGEERHAEVSTHRSSPDTPRGG